MALCFIPLLIANDQPQQTKQQPALFQLVTIIVYPGCFANN